MTPQRKVLDSEQNNGVLEGKFKISFKYLVIYIMLGANLFTDFMPMGGDDFTKDEKKDFIETLDLIKLEVGDLKNKVTRLELMSNTNEDYNEQEEERNKPVVKKKK